MAKLDSLLVKSKFRGCMLGCLIGDCLGGPFEGDQYSPGNKLVVHNYFEKLNRPKFEGIRYISTLFSFEYELIPLQDQSNSILTTQQ